MVSQDTNELRERLKQAIHTGEVLSIIYHGGSQPGALRQIAPIEIDDDKVRARCYMSKAIKTFSLNKIEFRELANLTPNDAASTWKPITKPPLPLFDTIAEVIAHYREDLEAKGWHVVHEIGEDGEYLNLFGRLKNGNMRKRPSVSLGYETIGYDLIVMPDGGVARTNPHPRIRPWSVRGNGGKSLGTWGRSEGAIRCFIEAADMPS